MPSQNQQQSAFDIQPQSSGPFDQYLQPTASVAAPRWDTGTQFSGFEHKAGALAGLGTKLLQGITNGRVRAYAQKEQARLQTWNRVTEQYHAVLNDPDVDPQLKAQISKQYYQLLGATGQEQLKDSKSTKDKGIKGQIAGVLNGVFEKLSGGPIKGDALTVEKMSEFMGTVTKAVQSGASASSAYQKQFDMIQQGISEAEAAQKAAGSPITAISRDQALANPKVRQGLSWFSTYAPTQLSIVDQMLPSTSRGNIKELASSSLANLPQHQKYEAAPGAAPPNTQAQPPGGPLAAAKAPGYLDSKYPAAPTGPPQAATPSAPPYTGPLSTEQYNKHVEEEDDTRRQLMDWAGVQPESLYIDPDSGQVVRGSKQEISALEKSAAARRQIKTHEDTEADRTAAAKDRKTTADRTFNEHIKEFNQNLTFKQRDENRKDQQLALQQARHNESLMTGRPAEEKALNDFVEIAASNGHPFGVIAADPEAYLDQFGGDTEIGQHRAYILGQIAAIKNKQNGGSLNDLAGALFGKSGTSTPPNTSKPTPSTPLATNNKSKVDAAKSALGLQ